MARILLVDDDPDILNFGTKVLELEDHEVIKAVSAFEAIEALSENSFDLVLSDANMPNCSGFELVKMIRQDERWKKTPIALLTARRQKQDVEQALKLGVNDYIVKPIDPTTLLNKVKGLLNVSVLPKNLIEIDFSESEAVATSRIQIKSHVIKLTEYGLKMCSTHPVDENQLMEVRSPIFKEIGIRSPLNKVISAKKIRSAPYCWEIETEFMGLKDSSLRKIRTWIQSKNPSVVRQAA